MNIVIINGSARKGNTLTTIDAFIKGASEKLDDPDATALQISNMVRDAIKPDITMFLHYETLEENGKKIVAVDIQRGTDRPYYIAKKECDQKENMSDRSLQLFLHQLQQSGRRLKKQMEIVLKLCVA